MSAQTAQTAQTAQMTTSVDQEPRQLSRVAPPSAQAAMGIPHDTVTELLRVIAAGSDDPVVMDGLAMGIPGEKAIQCALEPRTGEYGGPCGW